MKTIRPEFEPDSETDSPAAPPPMASPTLAWLRLMRLPNVFTAIADVAMGYLFVHGSVPDPATLGLPDRRLRAALYSRHGAERCVRHRESTARSGPSARCRRDGFRSAWREPSASRCWCWASLPAGRRDLRIRRARRIPWRSGVVATVLAACVLLYDRVLKSTPLGPLVMGLVPVSQCPARHERRPRGMLASFLWNIPRPSCSSRLASASISSASRSLPAPKRRPATARCSWRRSSSWPAARSCWGVYGFRPATSR